MIAISYCWEDSTSVAARLHDRLRSEFGKENVFMDFDSIPYGVDFREHIKRTLERADVVVAVVGPGWLGAQKEASRRIDDPSDFVRLEIAGALQRGIPVIRFWLMTRLCRNPTRCRLICRRSRIATP